jgi:precorrin-2 dehydrogenase/sirohydrochlorin ferrochelatase
MSDYPILLNLEGRLCVVVGGGPVGMRKVRGLRAAGARVRLIDPEPPVGEELPDLEVAARPYRNGDLQGAALVFAASGNREVNAAVAADARRAGIPVNVADAPQEGDFGLPALLRRGALTVAVSTAGRSPALAAVIRDRLAENLGTEWATVLDLAAALRQKRLTLSPCNEYNQAILCQLLDGDLPALIARNEPAAIDRLLATLLGEDFSLAELGVNLPKETA